jgi:3-oxoacyl-[acyl-carrier protein] reductase
MDLSLTGKNALICGSTQGIGLAIARELAILGANCILLARDEDALKTAVKGLSTEGGNSHQYLIADFIKPEEVSAVIQAFTVTTPIHILINNTGGPPAGAIIDAQEEAFLKTFNQHLIVNHILTKAVVTGMKAAGYGRIINIISTSVKIPLKNLGVSNTIRGAVASWAKTMANELGEYNITVNNVLPGMTKTQRLTSLIDSISSKTGKSAEDISKEMQAETPMKRFGEASEIAAVAAFLASPAASYVNGISIPVDGGRTGSI